jgi:hypothetical protein
VRSSPHDDLTALADAVHPQPGAVLRSCVGALQGSVARAEGKDRHRLLGQGRRRQDDLLDQPRGLPRLETATRTLVVDLRPRVRRRRASACRCCRQATVYRRREDERVTSTSRAWPPLVTKHSSGLEAVCAPAEPGDAERIPAATVATEMINQDVSDDILGYGPIDRLLKDDDVTEIMVNGPDSVFVERSGKMEKDPGRHLRGRGPPAAHHRQDRGPGRPAHRRVHPLCATPACPTAPASTR